MNWGALSTGMVAGQEADTRKRQEMAQAFADYRSANPEATAAEFQDFIDRFSGGRNYIAGGAPSGSILRSIGMDNQKRKAEAERDRRFAELGKRKQTFDMIRSMADEGLMGMQGDDYDKVRAGLVEQLGPDGASILTEYGGDTLFSPSRKDFLTGQRVREFLPGALELIRTTNGQLDPATLRTAFPDIPASTLAPIVKETKRLYEEESATKQRALDLEYADTESTIRRRLAEDKNFLAAIRSGDQTLVQRIIDQEISPYSGVFPNRFNDAFRSGVISAATASEAEAKRIRDIDEKNRQRATDLEYANTESTIRANLIASPDFQTAIRAGNAQAAQRIIDAAIKPYMAIFPGRFDAAFSTGVIEQAEGSAEEAQAQQHQQVYQDNLARATEATTLVGKASLESVNRAFRASENGTPSTLAGEAGAMGLLAAQNLATMFDTSSPAAIDTLRGIFADSAAKEMTMEQLIALGGQALLAAGVPTMASAKQAATMAAGQQVPEMTAFPEWRASIENEFRADFRTAGKLILDAQRITDPDQLKAEIARITNGIIATRTGYSRVFSDARATKNLWVPVGQPGWDEAAVSGAQNSLTSLMDAEVAALDAKLTGLMQLQAQLAQKAAAPAPTVQPGGVSLGGTPAATPQTGFQRTMGGLADNGEAKRLLLKASGQIASGGTSMPGSSPFQKAVDYFTEAPADPAAFAQGQADSGMLSALLQEPEAQAYLMANPQTQQLLASDPVAWAKQLDAYLQANPQQ